VPNGRVAVGALEPAIGDGAVRRLREVDAIPDEVVARVSTGPGPGHATPRIVVVVVLALPTGAAADLQPVLEPCKCRSHVLGIIILARLITLQLIKNTASE